MWDAPREVDRSAKEWRLLSHDRPCLDCGHALHTFLPCSDACGCRPQFLPGALGSLSPAV